MNKKPALQRLLRPVSIALFGGDPAAEVIRQCRKIGFSGDLWPVNPRRDEIEGLRCYRSVAELPGSPDASFIGVAPETSIGILHDLRTVNAGGAVCYASGFAETGREGRSLQSRLLEAAGDIAVIGPNCHGALNYLDGIALWPDEHGGSRVDRGVAFVLQSGNIGISISMQDRSLPIAYLITVGNKADLGFHDYVDALLDDPRVTAIGLHIEGLENVEAFSKTAIRALKQKIPMVAMKTGTSALGAEAALSHTSSLAGSDDLYAALFRRLGIARCQSIGGFLETLKFLSVNGGLPGNTVASMSCSGGEASMIADQAESLELKMPSLSAKTQSALREVLGSRVQIANPLDYQTYIWGDRKALTSCFTSVLGERCDCSILAIDYPRNGVCSAAPWEIAEQALIDAKNATGSCTVLMSSMQENLPKPARQRLLDAGIAPMQGLNECMSAIRAAVEVGATQAISASIAPVAPVRQTSGSDNVLNEWQSKQLLAAYGIAIPRGTLCTEEQLLEAAENIGYPLCMKLVSGDISHKSDIGGVRLNLRNSRQVAAAAADMRHLTTQFLLESMLDTPVAEIIAGVRRDAEFGLGLVIGSGGTQVELLRDTRTLLLPATREEIAAALSELKIARLIDGYRGNPAGDKSTVIDAIVAVAEFALAHGDSLVEMDINPLMILPAGRGAVAADALIHIRQ